MIAPNLIWREESEEWNVFEEGPGWGLHHKRRERKEKGKGQRYWRRWSGHILRSPNLVSVLLCTSFNMYVCIKIGSHLYIAEAFNSSQNSIRGISKFFTLTVRVFIQFSPGDQTKSHFNYSQDAIGYTVLAKIHLIIEKRKRETEREYARKLTCIYTINCTTNTTNRRKMLPRSATGVIWCHLSLFILQSLLCRLWEQKNLSWVFL